MVSKIQVLIAENDGIVQKHMISSFQRDLIIAIAKDSKYNTQMKNKL